MRVRRRRSAQAPIRASCAIKRESGAQWRAPLWLAAAWSGAAGAGASPRPPPGALSPASTLARGAWLRATGSAKLGGLMGGASIGGAVWHSRRGNVLLLDTLILHTLILDT